MNPAHLHLLVNHLPIIGLPFVAVVVAWGLIRKSAEVTRVGLALAVLVSIGTIPVYLTGEPAEEQIEEASWVNDSLVEPHEDRAKVALILTLVTGGLAAIALWNTRKALPTRPVLPAVALAALIASSAAMGWTGLSGGQIRHDEIRASTAPPPAASREDDERH